MELLWENGPATVHEMLEWLPPKSPLAYNTVLTTIRILEKKGYVRHEKSKGGRAHVYAPHINRERARRSEIGHLVRRFFQNSHQLLVLNLLEDRIDKRELDRLRELMESAPKGRP